MIIDKKGYETLEKQILEWEAASNVLDKTTQDVNKITRDLIKVLKKSDEKNLDTITAVLMFVIRSIMDGPDNVLELCQFLYDEFEYDEDDSPKPGPGETAMIHEDGTFVTLKELGIEE